MMTKPLAYRAIAPTKGLFDSFFLRVEIPYVSHYCFPNRARLEWLRFPNVYRGSVAVCFVSLCELAFYENGKADVAQCNAGLYAFCNRFDMRRPRLNCSSINMDNVIVYGNLGMMLRTEPVNTISQH